MTIQIWFRQVRYNLSLRVVSDGGQVPGQNAGDVAGQWCPTKLAMASARCYVVE